jgi:predicted O-methyltransferase YrrM
MDKTSYTNLAKMWELAEDRAFSHQSEDMNAVRRHAEESGSPQGSAQQAELLNLLVRIIGAASVIAVGTGSVVETLQLVKGLRCSRSLTT